MMKYALLVLFCLSAVTFAQEETSDVTPVLNPLDVRRAGLELEAEPKGWKEIGKGLCQVYEFSLNASVTSEEVADFILKEVPVKYRSHMFDEFIRGGTQFVSRLANVGCHLNRIKNWFRNHFHRSNNAETMDVLSKPFAGLRDSEDVHIMHMTMEYIHVHKNSGEDLHLIPETMCQVHDLSMEERVSMKRIAKTVQNMPAGISKEYMKRVLQLGKAGSKKIALLSSVGCKVLPAVVDLDVKTMTEEIEVETAVAAAHPKVPVPAVAAGICAVREFLMKANITHEQVADFILKKTPARFRSKLYEEFVKGGSTFAARVANVGCSMIKVKEVLKRMWPFGRLFHVLNVLSKPFAGLSGSDEFKLMHDAIEYIDKNRGQKGLMIIPETMCYIRKVSQDRRVTKESVVKEVEKKMPEELRKSLVDKILRFGVNSVARLADVACKTLPVHVEIDVKKTDPKGEDMAVSAAGTVAVNDIAPAGFHLPMLLGGKAFCELHHQLQERGVTHEKIIDFINRKMPRPLRKHLIQKITDEGIDKLALAARVGCKVMPIMEIAEMIDVTENDVQPASLSSAVAVGKEKFCELLEFGNKVGVTKSGVSQFIRIRFPDSWRKTLLGHLFERGLQAVVDVAHMMCFKPHEPIDSPF